MEVRTAAQTILIARVRTRTKRKENSKWKKRSSKTMTTMNEINNEAFIGESGARTRNTDAADCVWENRQPE